MALTVAPDKDSEEVETWSDDEDAGQQPSLSPDIDEQTLVDLTEERKLEQKGVVAVEIGDDREGKEEVELVDQVVAVAEGSPFKRHK